MSHEGTDPHVCGDRCLPSFFLSLESKLDSPLLQRAFDELKSDPSAFVSVGEWANKVGVSREHLTRSISPIINPHALLQSSRVAIALTRLARQDKLRAGEALDAMGYSSRAHAFAVFKKTTGLTPTQFWSRIQKSRQASTTSECVVDYCPLVGAVLDRYWRSTPAAGASNTTQDRESTLGHTEGPRATGT
jgi:AraC-like DNA-binding protein